MLHLLLAALFLAVCAGYFAAPLADSDFWWHIAAGRDIVQRGTLPHIDPFGVFAATDPVRSDTVLRGQWLGQVLLYRLFDAAGADAVVGFRTGILVACLLLVILRARLLGANQPWALWGVLALVALLAAGFGGERPQLLSFFFAALFFVFIDLARRQGNWRWLLPLPLLALVWANCHGGVMLGVALLAAWAVAAAFDRSLPRGERISWPALGAAVFAASLLTPVGIDTYSYLLQLEGSVLQQRTSEYTSALRVYQLGASWSQAWIYLYYALAAAGLAGLVSLRRFPEALMVLLLALLGVRSYRYLAFFLFIAAPYIVLGMERWFTGRLGRAVRSPGTLPTAVLALVLAAALVAGSLRGTLYRGGIEQERFPVAIADFIEESGLQGRAFNNLEWGGYLLWRLAGRVTPFIDGRMLEMARLPPYTHILWATPQGIRFFDRGGFDLVIMPYHGRFDPQQYGLIDYLSAHPGWRLAYRDRAGVVFVRR